MIHQNN